MRRRRFTIGVLAALLIGICIVAAVGYRNATAQPVVRRLTVHLPGIPANASPIRIALLSDFHVHGPDMPPARVAAIVEQVNAEHPDIDILAGDFVGDTWVGSTYPVGEAIAPLAGLKAKLGVYAVLGNNDYDVGATEVAAALERAGVTVLINRAVTVGPIALGGIDGRLLRGRGAWNSRRHWTYDSMRRTPGIPIVFAHRPDEFNWLPPSIPLMLAGHTHCGQIVLPLIGPLETGSDFGRRYLCGVIRRGSQTLVVTGGVGTSHLPLRIGAPPDIWMVSVEGSTIATVRTQRIASQGE